MTKTATISLRHDTGRRNRQSHRAWVARITGRDPQYGLARDFLDGEFYHDQGEDQALWGPRKRFELPLIEGALYQSSLDHNWVVRNGELVDLPKDEFLAELDKPAVPADEPEQPVEATADVAAKALQMPAEVGETVIDAAVEGLRWAQRYSTSGKLSAAAAEEPVWFGDTGNMLQHVIAASEAVAAERAAKTATVGSMVECEDPRGNGMQKATIFGGLDAVTRRWTETHGVPVSLSDALLLITVDGHAFKISAGQADAVRPTTAYSGALTWTTAEDGYQDAVSVDGETRYSVGMLSEADSYGHRWEGVIQRPGRVADALFFRTEAEAKWWCDRAEGINNQTHA